MPGILQHNKQELLRLITKGDEVVFAILINNYRNKIYSIAYTLTESTVVAEEIVQDTFLKIWLRREAQDDVIHFKAWLFTGRSNHVFSALKEQIEKKFYCDTVWEKTVITVYKGVSNMKLSKAKKETASILQRLLFMHKVFYIPVKKKVFAAGLKMGTSVCYAETR